MVRKLASVSSLVLKSDGGFARKTKRPFDKQQPDFFENFDSLTLCYDIFTVDSQIWGIGPPLYNLKELVEFKQGFCGGVGFNVFTLDLDRMSRWRFMGPSCRGIATDKGFTEAVFQPLAKNSEGFPFFVSCSENIFAGKRCLLTKSKNNDLEWIKYWVDFHVKHHKVNAVLFYDNGSDKYNLQEVLNVVGSNSKIDVAVVVDWPFKFGPRGLPGFWDSDFSQYGILEHARWRFLRHAEGVLSLDVDELVVGSASVFDLANHFQGYVLFRGRWIANVLMDGIDSVRHDNFMFYDDNVPFSPFKWCVVPSKLSVGQQWLVHSITFERNKPRWPIRLIRKRRRSHVTDLVLYRHFKGISTSWKYKRYRENFDSARHVVDQELVSAFEVVREVPENAS